MKLAGMLYFPYLGRIVGCSAERRHHMFWFLYRAYAFTGIKSKVFVPQCVQGYQSGNSTCAVGRMLLV